jgi:hypothetical protein
MTRRTPLYGLVLLMPLGMAGCDSKPPPLVAVHGRVTIYDVPLRSGMVVFTPDAERGTYGPNAVGTIGPDGQYALMTDGSPGVTPGWHRVTVACLQPPVGSSRRSAGRAGKCLRLAVGGALSSPKAASN